RVEFGRGRPASRASPGVLAYWLQLHGGCGRAPPARQLGEVSGTARGRTPWPTHYRRPDRHRSCAVAVSLVWHSGTRLTLAIVTSLAIITSSGPCDTVP